MFERYAAPNLAAACAANEDAKELRGLLVDERADELLLEYLLEPGMVGEALIECAGSIGEKIAVLPAWNYEPFGLVVRDEVMNYLRNMAREIAERETP